MRVCEKVDCNEKYSSNGYCKKHFNEWFRGTEKSKESQRKFKLSGKYKTNDPKYIKQRRFNTARWAKTEKGRTYKKIISSVGYRFKDVSLQCKVSSCQNEDIHKHHEDYNKPFEIIPLCAKHHRKLHNGELKLEMIL